MDDLVNQIEKYLNNKTNQSQNETNNYTNGDGILHKKEESNDSLERLPHLLEENPYIQLDEMERKFNQPKKDIETYLFNRGYQFNTIIEQWTIKNDEKILQEILSLLLGGLTLYDISGNFFKNNKKRIEFIDKVETFLKSENYVPIQNKRKWIKEKELAVKYVEQINNGLSMKDLAKEYKIQPTHIRFTLKKHNYRYDHLVDKWTKTSEYVLLQKLIRDYVDSGLSIEHFSSSKQINQKKWIEKLKQHNLYEYVAQTTPKSASEESKTATTPPKTENMESENVSQTQLQSTPFELNDGNFLSLFSSKEIEILKEIIKEYKEQQNNNEHKSRISFTLNDKNIERLNDLSDLKKINRSVLVDQILSKFFEQ
ncbi:hypothetical protein [Halobacillus faecis]|uniref:Uncharacterized protein n=1 Tax=Halobacillus faecis TaxID=360184 RepID=A0A511WMV9_9BACI|nr:hypothetical protein [Halobacillus faecis]GEN52405.1 hypothetical protein HFA01_06670 [Halobacillus faecis]